MRTAHFAARSAGAASAPTAASRAHATPPMPQLRQTAPGERVSPLLIYSYKALGGITLTSFFKRSVIASYLVNNSAVPITVDTGTQLN